jgi:1,5-anhydro-D-fructose reductase (1,5-anhydro-D-mannitol-forming)
MVNWAMIGTGRVNQQMAKGVISAAGSTLLGVNSRDHEKAKLFAKENDVARTYETLDELVSDPDVDVVYIASPNSLHREHVLAAAAAGKHVLCEKPMANDVQSSLDMIEACKANGVELGIAFQYRQHEAHRTVRDLVVSGAIGTPVFADAAVHVPPLPIPAWYSMGDVAGGGVVPMAGVHRIDLLRFVLNAEIEEISAFVKTREPGRPFEDTVTALLNFDNGTMATIRFALDVISSGDGVAVQGSSGWANAVRTTSQWWADDGGELSVSTSGETTTKVFPSMDLYRSQVEDFNLAVNGEGQFSASALDGLRAVEATLALFESARRGETVRVEHAEVSSDSSSSAQ